MTLPFVAAIPLKSRSMSGDWDAVQVNLRRTLRSLRAATGDLPVSAVIAGHDEPDLAGDVEGVHFVHAPFPEPESVADGGRDKARKRRLIGAWLRATLAPDGAYVMFLDADDLVHRGLVAHVLSGGHGSYLVESGYMFDARARVLIRRASAFSATCGSSFVCRFEGRELPGAWDDREAPYSWFGVSSEPGGRGHTEYDQVASELGRPPATIDFPAVVYTVNHTDSLWSARLNRLRGDHHARDLVLPRTARRVLTDEFAAPDLAAELGGLPSVPRLILHSARVRARVRLKR